MASVWAIVVAGGQGTRFGRPKQFEQILGKRVIDWSVQTASQCTDGVVVVVPQEHVSVEYPGASKVVAGGESRSASVRSGLQAIPEDCDIVLVHDAARPAASKELFESVKSPLLAQRPTGGNLDTLPNPVDPKLGAVIPGVQVTDTLKRVDGDLVVETVSRNDLVYVQTPQAFDAALLRQAHESSGEATDDAALLELVGARVMVVTGEAGNVKITQERDLDLVAEEIAALVASGRLSK